MGSLLTPNTSVKLVVVFIENIVNHHTFAVYVLEVVVKTDS